MSSLARCLDIYRESIAPEEAQALKKIARNYRSEGFSAREADQNVLRDVILGLEADLQSILKQAGATSVPPAPPAPTAAAPEAPVEKVAEVVIVKTAPETKAGAVESITAPVEKQAAEAETKTAATTPWASWNPATNGIQLPKPIGQKMPAGNMKLNPGESAPMLAPKPVPAAPAPVVTTPAKPATPPAPAVAAPTKPTPILPKPMPPKPTAAATQMPAAAPVATAPAAPAAPKPAPISPKPAQSGRA